MSFLRFRYVLNYHNNCHENSKFIPNVVDVKYICLTDIVPWNNLHYYLFTNILFKERSYQD